MEYLGDRFNLKLALIGSYVPRRCGIASFSNDLYSALTSLNSEVQVDVFAVGDGPVHDYPEEVVHHFRDTDLDSYQATAELINRGAYDAVLLQHEFGLFGGFAGEYIVDLLQSLNVPVITTMHTVLAQPDDYQRRVTDQLLAISQEIVVMNSRGTNLLTEVYNAPEDKISLIPHGIPDFGRGRREELRQELGIDGPMILTFGLLSPDKGVEFAIDAMPQIVERVPNATYVVLGATHPHIKSKVGEVYREKLIARTEELGVGTSIHFIDEFVSQDRLVDFLSAADIYITPYLNAQQITSGTLAYAVGAGKAVISTPYVYAEELLADERGVLVPFRDAEAIASAVIGLADDEEWRNRVRRNAREFGQAMTWPKVAESYACLVDPNPVVALPRTTRVENPEFSLRHLEAMTDDTGLFQHAIHTVPHRVHGYCLDDVARGLMLTARLDSWQGLPGNVLQLERTYLAFVLDAFDESTGLFRNFMSYGREWLEKQGADDAVGRALYALATVAARSAERPHREVALSLFRRSVGSITNTTSPRGWASAILAADELLSRDPHDAGAWALLLDMSDRLYSQYKAGASPGWPWFEDVVSYENARLCQAMIVAGNRLDRPAMTAAGLVSLSWLAKIQTGVNGVYSPIGSDGFYRRGSARARFDQQPLEAWAMVSACVSAADLTKDRLWVAEATRAYRWFLGENDAGLVLCDIESGGCRDGLHPRRVNENQGAESTLSFLFAQQEMMALGQLNLPTDLRLVSV